MPRGQCENCKKAIPSNQWCCEDCFPFYDWEKFLGTEDYEIQFVTSLGDDDE